MVRLRSLVVVVVAVAAGPAPGDGVGVGSAVGTWTPALMWMSCSFAAACSPSTKGDPDSGLARERDSCGEEAI